MLVLDDDIPQAVPRSVEDHQEKELDSWTCSRNSTRLWNQY